MSESENKEIVRSSLEQMTDTPKIISLYIMKQALLAQNSPTMLGLMDDAQIERKFYEQLDILINDKVQKILKEKGL